MCVCVQALNDIELDVPSARSLFQLIVNNAAADGVLPLALDE
jgi:hypothetical protein